MTEDSRPDGEAAAPLHRRAWRAALDVVWGSEEDFTSGSLNRGVLLLAIPMVLEMAGESLFFLVDMAVVSRLGAGALAAIALTEAMLAVIYSVAMGLAMSTTAMVARRTGEGDERGAATAAVQAILLSAAIAAILGLTGAILAPRLLTVMGGSPEVVAAGTTYARIQLGGMVVIILLFVNNAIYRGAGDPSMAMRSVWISPKPSTPAPPGTSPRPERPPHDRRCAPNHPLPRWDNLHGHNWDIFSMAIDNFLSYGLGAPLKRLSHILQEFPCATHRPLNFLWKALILV